MSSFRIFKNFTPVSFSLLCRGLYMFCSLTSIGLASDFPDVNNGSGMCKPPDNTDYPHQERGLGNQANPALHSLVLKHFI